MPRWFGHSRVRTDVTFSLFKSAGYYSCYYALYSLSFFPLAKSLQLILESSATYRLVSLRVAAPRLSKPLATSSLAVGRFAAKQGSLRSPRSRLVARLSRTLPPTKEKRREGAPSLRLTLTSTLIISDITKNSSNNCSEFHLKFLPAVNGRGGLPRSPEGGGEGVLRALYSDLGGSSSRIGCLFQASGTWKDRDFTS